MIYLNRSNCLPKNHTPQRYFQTTLHHTRAGYLMIPVPDTEISTMRADNTVKVAIIGTVIDSLFTLSSLSKAEQNRKFL